MTAREAESKELARQLLSMTDEEFYNWILGASNPTGAKRLKWLRAIIERAAK